MNGNWLEVLEWTLEQIFEMAMVSLIEKQSFAKISQMTKASLKLKQILTKFLNDYDILKLVV